VSAALYVHRTHCFQSVLPVSTVGVERVYTLQHEALPSVAAPILHRFQSVELVVCYLESNFFAYLCVYLTLFLCVLGI